MILLLAWFGWRSWLAVDRFYDRMRDEWDQAASWMETHLPPDVPQQRVRR